MSSTSQEGDQLEEKASESAVQIIGPASDIEAGEKGPCSPALSPGPQGRVAKPGTSTSDGDFGLVALRAIDQQMRVERGRGTAKVSPGLGAETQMPKGT